MDNNSVETELIWKDRKRWTFFGIPWTFTKYSMTPEVLYIDTGFLSQRQDEIRLYRVMDITLTRSFAQRIFGLGTIKMVSSDKSMGTFSLKNIKNSKDVKAMLSRCVEQERDRKRVSARELMHDFAEDADDYTLN